ncbi:MAG: uracil-DNA glycosylase, partial [Candidatus Aminicenantales bacterium]
MEKDAERVLDALGERLKFFTQIGVEFIPSPASSRQSRYLSLREEILRCQRCGLARERMNAVPGEGSLEAALMFVGEAPGRDEDIQGKPFVGRAGQLLTKIIQAMSFRREEVYITNVVKCRPPKNRTPHREEIEKCRGYLLEQIQIINPRVIVTLGKVAADFFIQSPMGMTALRGQFHEFGAIRIMPT